MSLLLSTNGVPGAASALWGPRVHPGCTFPLIAPPAPIRPQEARRSPPRLHPHFPSAAMTSAGPWLRRTCPSSSSEARAWTARSGNTWGPSLGRRDGRRGGGQGESTTSRSWILAGHELRLLGPAWTRALLPGVSSRPWCSVGRPRNESGSSTSSPSASITATPGFSPQ